MQTQRTSFAVLCWLAVSTYLLDQQASKATANVSKAHQLIILLTTRGGGLTRLAAALRVVWGPAIYCHARCFSLSWVLLGLKHLC
jgi:hypothetical protein